MTNPDQIISRILEARSTLTREKLVALIEEKKREAGGLLSEEGAARLIAEQLLIETETHPLGGLVISDVTSGLNAVTITGRVIAIRPVQEFQKRNGQSGKVLSVILADKSGQIRCAVWDNKADEAIKAGLAPGRILRVQHAYTRNGLTGLAELHVGDRGVFTLDPQDASDADFPKARAADFAKISEIDSEIPRINVQAILQGQPRIITFRRNGGEGKVLRAQLSDGAGTIGLVAWDEKADELQAMTHGASLQLINARVKRDRAGLLEIHVENSSTVTVVSQGHAETSVVLKVSDLKAGQQGVTIVVRILAKSEPVETKRLTGGPLRFARMLIGDDTGISTAVFWEEKVQACADANVGDVLEIVGASVRERQDDISVSIGSSTSVKTRADLNGLVSAPVITKISELPKASGLVAVQGRVDEEPLVREVTTAKGESISVGSFRLRDETGIARVNFWRQHAQSVSKLRLGMAVRITGLRAKPGLDGSLELSSIPLTALETSESSASVRPSWSEVTQIIALEKPGPAWVQGTVLEFRETASLKAVCGSCGREMSVSAGGMICSACGNKDAIGWNFSGAARIDDGTGAMTVVFDSVDSRSFLGELIPWASKRATATFQGDIRVPTEALSRFVGSKVEVSGEVSFTDDGKPSMKAKKAVIVSET